ncbi:MAG: pseudouridine-5'-phosphate glycosidase [Phycisphaerales bacterium]|nr:pseudouridine-5'-phosphate glycosidase [Phycisphaerales bacterium]
MQFLRRSIAPAVALETTLLVHGVPRDQSLALAHRLDETVRSAGAHPALIGLIQGVATVGMTAQELQLLLDAPEVPKANTANLGALAHRKSHAATTVSTTMELAGLAGIRVFATGGIGGVHKGYGEHLDISADLSALARYPVAVVASGCKSILDVAATREALETLGVPVIGYQTDTFPQFYCRQSDLHVDARFDDAADMARFVSHELARTGRGILVANPIPSADELEVRQLAKWTDKAFGEAGKAGASGRDVTPFVLGRLHELSEGATLRANIALVESNARLAGQLAAAMHAPRGS